jgi:uncharacterized protein (TIGR00251 family)
MPAQQVKINLKVIPQAKANKVEQPVLDEKGNINLKLRVSAPAVDGKANEAVIKLLAEHYKVSKSCVDIVSGWTSRQKVVIIQKISEADVMRGSQIKLI